MSQTANRIAVIGAGIAGLVTAKVLRADGFDVTVFEKEPAIGGVWAPSRTYPGLRANNPRETYAFSDHAYPQSADEYPTADHVRAYLVSYVERFDLQPLIRLGAEVTYVDRRSGHRDGGQPRFEVSVRPGTSSEAADARTHVFDFVVVCNGVFSVPHLPEIPHRARFGGQLLHSSELAHVRLTPDQRVVVVGAGKSALDCAAAAASQGAATTLAFRRPHWMVPQFFSGGVRADRVIMTRLAEMFLKHHTPSRVEALLHGPGRWLVRWWWERSARLVRRDLGLPDLFTPDEPLSSAFANIGIGGAFYDLLRAGRIVARRAGLSCLTDSGVALDDGGHVPADVVVLATGWRQGVPFLAPDLRNAVLHDGRFRLYRHILPATESRLGFVGYASSVACQLTSEIGAHWLSQCFRGELALPDIDRMEREILRVEQWAAGTFPHRDSGYFIGPFLAHYADELLRDMGLPTQRLNSVFAEYLRPIWPERYAALAAERRRARGDRV